MGDVDVRESTRRSILRLAAIANGNELVNESAELIEVREKQLVQHFRRFHEEHLRIVADVDGVNEEARAMNHELYSETEEEFMIARARMVRLIRSKQAEDQRIEAEAIRLAAIQQQAVVANAQREVIVAMENQAVNDNEQQVNADVVNDQGGGGNQAFNAEVLQPDELRHQPMAPQQPMPAVGPQAAEADGELEGAVGGAQYRHIPPNAEELRQLNQQRADQNKFVVVIDNNQHMQLPKFDGNFANWIEFRDSFIQLVHNRTDKTSMAKLNLLLQHLTGDAQRYLAGMQRCSDNYPIAWQMLMEEYEQPRVILQLLLLQLKELRPLSEGNATGLRYVVLKHKQVLRQVEAMGFDIEAMAPPLIRDLLQILDHDTRFEWEKQQRSREPKPISDLLGFLEHHANCMLLARPVSGNRRAEPNSAVQSKKARTVVGHLSEAEPTGNTTIPSGCVICKQRCQHVTKCRVFLEYGPYKRQNMARKLKLCFGCLGANHGVNDCQSAVCPHCTSGRNHHQLLCFAYHAQQNPRPEPTPTVGLVRHEVVEAEPTTMAVNTVASASANQRKRSLPLQLEQLEFERKEHPLAQIVMANQASGALLATALVRVRATTGEFKVLRALCDTGAQTNLITERAVQMLAVTKSRTNESLCPVGGSTELSTRGTVQVVLAPLIDNSQLFRIQIKAFVLKKVTSPLPAAPLHLGTWPTSISANFADPTAAEPGAIDMLLGAHVWSLIQQQGFFNNWENSLVAQETRFGWLLFGGIAAPGKTLFGHIGLYETETPPDQELHRLWELEAVAVPTDWSNEEQRCEEIFAQKVQRLPSGRYCVPIPLKDELSQLGKSHQLAVKRFHHTEKRFARDSAYKRKYVEFMADYIAQGHMRVLPKPMDLTLTHYFIPHHGLDKEKFRVVFDASAATSSGVSCNDMQLLGARLQCDLLDIILRFRCNKFALVADIKQMYRQMVIPDEQQRFQLVLWRKSPMEKLLTYALTTVTYGMKHAPHTAVRTLQQIAQDNRSKYPYASYIAKRDFYMDDLITGAATVDRTIELYRQMKAMMDGAGMNLRKWATNSWNVLQELDEADTSTIQPIAMDQEEVRSVLGAYWCPTTDEIQFKFHSERSSIATTKRTITGEVARIFDPTGLLAPMIVRGKLFIREMWLNKYDWDAELLPELAEEWQEFQSTLDQIDQIRVPRWMKCENLQAITLHGFAGASETAYAAAIYGRVEITDGTVKCQLLTSKTKVAPMKRSTVHRLELSAGITSPIDGTGIGGDGDL